MSAQSNSIITQEFYQGIFPYNTKIKVIPFDCNEKDIVFFFKSIANVAGSSASETLTRLIETISIEIIKNNCFRKENVFKITMPRIFRNINFSKIIDNFKDSFDIREFYLYKTNGYPSKELEPIIRKEFIKMSRKSKPLGYSFKSETASYKTQFYLVYQEIQLQYAKAIIREHILNELNKLAKKQGAKIRYIIKGLPYPTDYKKILNNLMDGSLGLDNVYCLSQIPLRG